MSDVDKNIMIYTYQPDAKESFGGQCLLRKMDFHVGAHISCYFRIRCKLTHLLEDKKAFVAAEKRHITMYGTQDGGVGYMLPVSEKVYRRLLMLQNLLVTNLPHYAGLNPKAFRYFSNIFSLCSGIYCVAIISALNKFFCLFDIQASEYFTIGENLLLLVPLILILNMVSAFRDAFSNFLIHE